MPWAAKKINVEIMEEAEQTKSLVNRLRKRRATFIGHVARRQGLKHILTTAELEGRGEQMMDSLAACMDTERAISVIQAFKERGVWKNMIANAIKQVT